jgi:NTE family protein
MPFSKRLWCLASAAVLVGACATFPKDMHLEKYDAHKGYRFANLSPVAHNPDELFVVVAFSGGGTRAAALAYGVLDELRHTEVRWQGDTKPLNDEIDIISSVSGGSFTAAYYALRGNRLFDGTFERSFLKRDTESALTWQLLSPANLLKLASSSYGRSDLAADYYDREIFGTATYADLVASGRRPFVMINATDMTLGAQFPFTQDQFDLLCSDLSHLPIARAVAASSAFPGLLTPLSFENYAGTCSYQEPVWVQLAQNDRRINPERAQRASTQRTYYAAAAGAVARPFVHLLDGGVADNIGLRDTIYALTSTDPQWSILGRIDRHEIKKLVIIVVNAATNPDAARDRSAAVPGVFDVVLSSATIPLDNYSFDTVRWLEGAAAEINEGPRMRKSCAQLLGQACPGATLPGGEIAPVDLYVVQVAFDFIDDAEERHFFKNLPTNFNLPPDEVDKLEDVGRRLLREDPQFQRLIADLQ